MAYIRTCVQNLGEIRRPVRNNCPSSLIIDEDIGPGRDDLSSQWTVWCSHLLKLPYNYAVGL